MPRNRTVNPWAAVMTHRPLVTGRSRSSTLVPLLSALRDHLPPGRCRHLDGPQAILLLERFREEQRDLVDDAGARGISQGEANRLSVIHSIIRWLKGGEHPGRGAVPLLEWVLTSFTPTSDDDQLRLRAALLAAIHDLGGDEGAAAEIWGEDPDDLPDGLFRYGMNLHRLMRQAGLTVEELAERACLAPAAVVAFIYGVEEPTVAETFRLAGAVGVTADALFVEDQEAARYPRPGLGRGLNVDRPQEPSVSADGSG